jgi:prevent-host-death family protein
MRYSEGMRVSIREFKTQAVELVRRAEAGEEVTITRGSRAVAVLKPAKATAEEPDEEVLERLARMGLLRKGDGLPFSKTWRPVKGKGKPLSQIVIEDRREGY